MNPNQNGYNRYPPRQENPNQTPEMQQRPPLNFQTPFSPQLDQSPRSNVPLHHRLSNQSIGMQGGSYMPMPNPAQYSPYAQPVPYAPYARPVPYAPAYYYAAVQPIYIHQYMLDMNQGAALVKKEIPLTKDGNLVVEYPLSLDVLRDAKYREGKEFTHVRYTPITCEPNDLSEHYTLRQIEMRRETKIALVMTMYNEDEVLFCKSMKAVFKNVKQFCDYYGPDFWKHIVVVIVSDGRAKINARTLTVLGTMGCYADGLMQTSVNEKPVQAHLFEFTPQICCNFDGDILTAKDDVPPVQMLFLLKEKNAKKINSHRWFFNGVCHALKPEVCMLLDVGTKPTPRSFLELWKVFDRDQQVGGACGEIAAELGSGCQNLLNPLVAAQNFEYKMSNILDKPMESVFGFISVLPGAFSAYRYRAIQGAPLDAYFFGETMHGAADAYKANMYLAEDRILCFEIVAKKQESWLLRYVKSAKAETDVPDRLDELISQRRRWLNGSFFAAVHSILHWAKIYQSGHSGSRKAFLTLEFVYNVVNLLFSWFSVANFYLAFYFLFDVSNGGDVNQSDSNVDPFGAAGPIVSEILLSVYVFLIVAAVIMSLGNRPQGAKIFYHTIVIFFAMIMVLIMFLSIWSVVLAMRNFTNSPLRFLDYVAQTPAFRDIVVALGSTYGAYVVASLLHYDPWHCLTSMAQYLLMLPSYVNILMIYAFCNINDLSWGTKGENVITTGEGAKVTTSSTGEQVAEVKLPSLDSKDVDVAYQNLLSQFKRNALTKELKENKRDAKTKQDDYFRQFRTNVVLLWITTNAVLVYVFTSKRVVEALAPPSRVSAVNPYLTFLFWTVAALSLFRFFFSLVYIMGHWKNKIRYFCHKPEPLISRI